MKTMDKTVIELLQDLTMNLCMIEAKVESVADVLDGGNVPVSAEEAKRTIEVGMPILEMADLSLDISLCIINRLEWVSEKMGTRFIPLETSAKE